MRHKTFSMTDVADPAWNGSPADRRPWLCVALVVVEAGATALLLGLIGGLWGRTPAGNTALVVAFGGGPAIIAGAWVALTLALRMGETRTARLWLGAVLAGAAALVASMVGIYAPIVSAESNVNPALLIAATDLLAAILGVLVARGLGYRLTGGAWLALGASTMVIVVLLQAVPGLGALLNLVFAPLLVALPLAIAPSSSAGAGWGAGPLSLTWLAVLFAVVAGVQLGGYLIAVL
jgi:hypothetical protein